MPVLIVSSLQANPFYDAKEKKELTQSAQDTVAKGRRTKFFQFNGSKEIVKASIHETKIDINDTTLDIFAHGHAFGLSYVLEDADLPHPSYAKHRHRTIRLREDAENTDKYISAEIMAEVIFEYLLKNPKCDTIVFHTCFSGCKIGLEGDPFVKQTKELLKQKIRDTNELIIDHDIKLVGANGMSISHDNKSVVIDGRKSVRDSLKKARDDGIGDYNDLVKSHIIHGARATPVWTIQQMRG